MVKEISDIFDAEASGILTRKQVYKMISSGNEKESTIKRRYYKYKSGENKTIKNKVVQQKTSNGVKNVNDKAVIMARIKILRDNTKTMKQQKAYTKQLKQIKGRKSVDKKVMRSTANKFSKLIRESDKKRIKINAKKLSDFEKLKLSKKNRVRVYGLADFSYGSGKAKQKSGTIWQDYQSFTERGIDNTMDMRSRKLSANYNAKNVKLSNIVVVEKQQKIDVNNSHGLDVFR